MPQCTRLNSVLLRTLPLTHPSPLVGPLKLTFRFLRETRVFQTTFLSLVLVTYLKHMTPPATLQVLVGATSQPPISDEALGLKILEHFNKYSLLCTIKVWTPRRCMYALLDEFTQKPHVTENRLGTLVLTVRFGAY